MQVDDARGASAGLASAFVAAMPDPQWARAAPQRTVVALLAVQDWLPWRRDAEALMDAHQHARMSRQHHAVDRDTLTIAYACHRLLLGAALERSPHGVPLIRDALGCPRLRDGSASTSLSHSGGYVAIAVSLHEPVGVDLEPVARASSMAEIEAHICHPHESQALAALDPAARARELLALWVRKEALLKSAGIGLGRDVTSFVAPAGVALAALQPDAPDVAITMLDAGDDCCAAVAAGVDHRIHCRWLRPGRPPSL